MSIRTTTTRKVPTLGTTYQTLKDNPRVFDSIRGLDKRVKSLVEVSIANDTSQEALNDVIEATLTKLKIGYTETLFLGYFVHGGDVSVASVPANYISPLDSYIYVQAEVVNYSWNFTSSRLPSGGFVNGQLTRPTSLAPGTGGGNILWWDSDVDPATNLVSLEVGYYVQGGAETDTNDGIVKVYANMKRLTF